MARINLADHIALNLIDTDRFKSALLSVNLIVPIKRETAPMNTLLLQVIKQGTAKYRSLAELDSRLDDLYAAGLELRNEKRGDMQVLGFAIDWLDRAYVPDDVDLLAGVSEIIEELLLHPLLDEHGYFCAETVAREKTALCDAIRARINNKGRYAYSRCIEEMCRNEAFGLHLSGSEEEVRAITPQALTARYHALLREAKVECFFVGNTKTASIASALAQVFKTYPTIATVEATTEIIRRADRVREITECQPVKQGRLVLGFRSGYAVADEDYLDFMTFCELYGGSPTSKLFMQVRERLSLCYSCGASMNSYKGLMFVSCGISPQNRQAAFEEIMRQLEEIRAGKFTEEELHNAIVSLQNGYRQIKDSPGGLENYSLGRLLFGVDLTVEQMEAGFAAVTAEAVVKAAKRVSLDTVYFLDSDADNAAEEEADDE